MLNASPFKSGRPIEPGAYSGCLRNLRPIDYDVFQRIEESA